MSSESTPISPTRFAAALTDLSLPSLHLKVLELRNSIAHLDYSNEQLKPFAEASPPDSDCVEAIAENLQIIERMQERIRLVREEVETNRGFSWTEFQSKEELERELAAQGHTEPGVTPPTTNGTSETTNGDGPRQHSAWTDGTFQTGVIRNGEIHMDQQSSVAGQQQQHTQSEEARQGGGGGSLSDEELRRRMEEQLRNLGDDDDNDDQGGLHL